MMSLIEVFSDFISHAGINPSLQVNSFITAIASHFATSVFVIGVISSMQTKNSNVFFILKTVMLNGITIFDDQFAYNRLFTVIEAYSKIWRDTDEDIVNISKEQ